MEHTTPGEDQKRYPQQTPNTDQNGDGRKTSPEKIARILTRLRNIPIEKMTVADRLTLRALERRETLVIDSASGEIEIVIRPPLAVEVREIETLQADVLRTRGDLYQWNLRLVYLQGRARDGPQEDLIVKLTEAHQALDALQAGAAAANLRLLEIITGLCDDESITVEFLESGLFAPEDIGGLVQSILQTGQGKAPTRATKREALMTE